jgi:siroheme synthase-like protein
MNKPPSTNRLFPIFLKLNQLHTLVIGGGNVGLEKLTALLKNDPKARITIVSPEFHPGVTTLAEQHTGVRLVKRCFTTRDLTSKDLVILATADWATNREIVEQCKSIRLLVNVADTPDLCDFYLGSTVTKGHLKIGISTNGKSPTLARRIREILEKTFPDDTHALLNNLGSIRKQLTGSFKQKLERLNAITSVLVDDY